MNLQDVDLSTLVAVADLAREMGINRATLHKFCLNYQKDKGLWRLPHVTIGEKNVKFVPREVAEEFKKKYVPGRGIKYGQGNSPGGHSQSS